MPTKYGDIIAFTCLSLLFMTIVNVAFYLFAPSLLGAVIPLEMFIPLLSAIITNRFITKRSLRDFGFKKGTFAIKYVLFAVVFPLCAVFLGSILGILFGLNVDLTLSGFFAEIQLKAQELNIPYEALLLAVMIQLIIAPFFNTLFAFGEEAGWRGFLLGRLEEECGRLKAILLSGFIWGIWHYPLILLFGYDYTYETRFLGSLVFLLFVIPLGFILSWLRFKTDSVLLPSLGHGAVNAYIGFGTYTVLAERVIGFPAGVLAGISMTIIVIILFIFDKETFIGS